MEEEPNLKKIEYIDKIISFRLGKGSINEENLFNLFDYLYDQEEEVLELTIKKLYGNSRENC